MQGSTGTPLHRLLSIDLANLSSFVQVFDKSDSGAILITDLELLQNQEGEQP